MKRIIIPVLFTVFVAAIGAASALACEGEAICRYAGAAWTRCIHSTVTLRFDDAHGRRQFVTIDRADAERLYADLHARLEGGK